MVAFIGGLDSSVIIFTPLNGSHLDGRGFLVMSLGLSAGPGIQ